MKVLTAEQMRILDKTAIEQYGVPGAVLMENAGRGATDFFCDQFASLFPGPVLVVAGKGNNGGDGYVIARHLDNRGWQVRTVVLAESEQIQGDAALNLDVLLRSKLPVDFCSGENAGDVRQTLDAQGPVALIVDAIFGNGLTKEVRGHYAEAIEWINSAAVPVAAVDMPSGIDATTGHILGRCIQAQCSATFALPKLGQVLHPAAEAGGKLYTVDIGMPRVLTESCADEYVFVQCAEAYRLLPARPATGHKGTFGHLLIVAGSSGKSGAAAMTAEGAARMGAGLVTLACPASIHGVLENKLTEPMTAPLADVHGALSQQALADIEQLWSDKKALALGPGLGVAEDTTVLVRRLVRECPLPMVIDADGLNALASDPSPLKARSKGTAVLTPHPGEMARLLGIGIEDVEQDRVGVASAFAVEHRVVLVLKGARTVTAFPDGKVRLNGSGNPGLASGGMGDVLTGMIAGLLSQGLTSEDAATLGVFLHGFAADRLSLRLGTAGMLASDLLREIPAARHALETQGE